VNGLKPDFYSGLIVEISILLAPVPSLEQGFQAVQARVAPVAVELSSEQVPVGAGPVLRLFRVQPPEAAVDLHEEFLRQEGILLPVDRGAVSFPAPLAGCVPVENLALHDKAVVPDGQLVLGELGAPRGKSVRVLGFQAWTVAGLPKVFEIRVGRQWAGRVVERSSV
jgi:hypothetical protein